MARSDHARYDAATKHERSLARRSKPARRRESTRYLQIRAAIQEA